MFTAVWLSVVMLIVIVLCNVMPSVIILSNVMLCVIGNFMVSNSEFRYAQCRYSVWVYTELNYSVL